jgi:hypothetical protein
MILQFRFDKDRRIFANISNDFYRVYNEYLPDFTTLVEFLIAQGYGCETILITYDALVDDELVSMSGTGLEIDDEDAVAFLIKYG